MYLIHTTLCTKGGRDVLLDGRRVREGTIHCDVSNGHPEHECARVLGKGGTVAEESTIINITNGCNCGARNYTHVVVSGELSIHGVLEEVVQGKEVHCGEVAEGRLEEVASNAKEHCGQNGGRLAEVGREVRGQPGAEAEDTGEHKGESGEHHGVGGESNLHRGHFKCVVFFCIGQIIPLELKNDIFESHF